MTISDLRQFFDDHPELRTLNIVATRARGLPTRYMVRWRGENTEFQYAPLSDDLEEAIRGCFPRPDLNDL